LFFTPQYSIFFTPQYSRAPKVNASYYRRKFVFSLLRPHPHIFLVLLRFPRLFFVSFSISIFLFHLSTVVSPPLLLFWAMSFLHVRSLSRVRPNTLHPTRCRRRFQRVSVSVACRTRGSGNKPPYSSFTACNIWKILKLKPSTERWSDMGNLYTI